MFQRLILKKPVLVDLAELFQSQTQSNTSDLSLFLLSYFKTYSVLILFYCLIILVKQISEKNKIIDHT